MSRKAKPPPRRELDAIEAEIREREVQLGRAEYSRRIWDAEARGLADRLLALHREQAEAKPAAPKAKA